MANATYRRLLRDCWSKGKYSQLEKARAGARAVAEREGVTIYGYTCRHCGTWHLTKQPTYQGERLRVLAPKPSARQHP